jgi:predicted enzyme related to lactoylglutathione lyase
MGNPFVFCELYSNDIAKSKKFYTALLDWKINDMDMPSVPGGKYTMIEVGGDGTGGGMLANPMPNNPGGWTPYANVADVAATLKKAEGLGATVVVPKTEVMNMGWIGMITDPTGVMFGFWESKTQ